MIEKKVHHFHSLEGTTRLSFGKFFKKLEETHLDSLFFILLRNVESEKEDSSDDSWTTELFIKSGVGLFPLTVYLWSLWVKFEKNTYIAEKKA